MGKLANKTANMLLDDKDENGSEGFAQMIWCVYTGLENWKNRVRRKLFGTRLMDEYVTNYLWTEWREYCVGDRKPTISQIRMWSHGIVERFELEIEAERPIRERFLDIVTIVVRFCYNIPKQSGA